MHQFRPLIRPQYTLHIPSDERSRHIPSNRSLLFSKFAYKFRVGNSSRESEVIRRIQSEEILRNVQRERATDRRQN
jgi:hypothetical protein